MININNLDEVFSYNTKGSEIKEICDYIANTFRYPEYRSIPKEYFSFLCILLSFRKYDYRGQYKPEDIRTFFVGKTSYNNYAIMFYDKEGNCDSLGVTNAIKEWQKEKKNRWDNEKRIVLGILRNISSIRIKEIRTKLSVPVKDEISGKIINNIEDIHIDHYNDDFAKVAYDWLHFIKKDIEKRGGKFIDIIHELYQIKKEDNTSFTDDFFNKSFLEYHDKHTHLRITSKHNNLQREKYKPTWDYLKYNGYYLEKYAQESNK